MVVTAPIRLAAYDPLGVAPRGVLPTIGLTVSAEVGGAGSVRFDAITSDLGAVDGWDSVVHLQVWDGTAHTPVAAYALRRPYTRRVMAVGSDSVWTCQAASLIEAWASHTLLYPEYTQGTAMPRGAGEERHIGWQMAAYDPATDPREPWTGCYNTSRSAKPPGWPSGGSGAKWISVTGATDSSERKLFRAWLDLSSYPGPQLCRVWLSSDESAALYIGGERLIESASVETGYEEITRADIVLWPERHAVAVDTATDFTKGGDGVDPIIVAIAVLDDDGRPASWPLVSSEAAWVACRRNDEPPGEEPPGPTPGAVILALLAEAQSRGVEGWAGVTADFTAALDSDGTAWPAPVIERVWRVGADTLWSVLQALAETNEVDCWLTPALVLKAAPRQGKSTPTVTLDSTVVASMREERPEPPGSVAVGLTQRGWTSGARGGVRREYGLELGTAPTERVAARVIAADLATHLRRDLTVDLLPSDTIRPLLDLEPGDAVHVNYGDVTVDAAVLSMSASVADSVCTWQAELVTL